MRILACTLLVAAAPCLAQEIVVGQSAPLTGGNAELGNDIRNGPSRTSRR
jgi:branched-chain amino acid transport system substrate-binding protein